LIVTKTTKFNKKKRFRPHLRKRKVEMSEKTTNSAATCGEDAAVEDVLK